MQDLYFRSFADQCNWIECGKQNDLELEVRASSATPHFIVIQPRPEAQRFGKLLESSNTDSSFAWYSVTIRKRCDDAKAHAVRQKPWWIKRIVPD